MRTHSYLGSFYTYLYLLTKILFNVRGLTQYFFQKCSFWVIKIELWEFIRSFSRQKTCHAFLLCCVVSSAERQVFHCLYYIIMLCVLFVVLLDIIQIITIFILLNRFCFLLILCPHVLLYVDKAFYNDKTSMYYSFYNYYDNWNINVSI